MLEFLSGFQNLVQIYSITASVALIVLFVYLSMIFVKDKELPLLFISFFFIFLGYTLLYTSIKNPEIRLLNWGTVIAGALAFSSTAYFNYKKNFISKNTLISIVVLFVVLVPVKILLSGVAAWIIMSAQILFIAFLFVVGIFRFFNVKKFGLQALVIAGSILLLVIPLVVDIYVFYVQNPFDRFPNRNVLTLFHFISLIFVFLNNKKWFNNIQRRSINLVLSFYVLIHYLVAWIFYKGTYYWTQLVLLDVFHAFVKGKISTANQVWLNFPLILATIMFTIIMIILLIVVFFVFRNFKKQRQIRSLLRLNNRIFNGSIRPLIILESGIIVRANQAFTDFSGYTSKELLNKDAGFLFDRKSIHLEKEKDVNKRLRCKNGQTKKCLIQNSSFLSEAKKYQLLIIEDLGRVHKELEESVFYNNILQVLITDSSWNMRLKLIAQLIKAHLRPREILVRLVCFEDNPQYGILALSWLDKVDRFFNEQSSAQESLVLGDEQCIVIRLGKQDKNYGFLAVVFHSSKEDETRQSQLSTVSYVLSQFIESDFLYTCLAASEHIYKALIENSLTGIYIYQDEQIQFVNKRFSLMTGFQVEDIVQVIQPGDLCENVFEKKQLKVQTNDVLNQKKKNSVMSFKSHRADGQEIWLSIYMAHIEYQAKPAVICHLLDITRQVEITRQKKKMTDLLIKDQRMTTMRNLVRGIAHEFNNVFAIIKGYTELLQSNPDRASQDLEDLQVIMDTIQRGREISDRMHIFAKQENMEIVPIAIKTLFKNCQSSFSSVIRRHKSEVKLQFDQKQENILVLADVFNLEHVLHNLLFNALDASHAGGNISITAEATQEEINIVFEDDGTGIPESDIRFVFDPFYSTKEGEQGAGLGLYICHEIIQSMNGKIFLESEPGKFTRLIITLPRASQKKLE